MKKFLSIMLALAMLLSLTACGKKTEKDNGDTGPETEELETIYDFSSPEVDPENAPAYYYYIQSVNADETSLTKLLAEIPGEGYADKVQDEIRKIAQFSRSDIVMQYMDNGEDDVPPEEGNDYVIYAQDIEYSHEIDVSVYGSLGYNYITYGTTQTISDIALYESQLDIDSIPELCAATTGIKVSRNDIVKALNIIQEIMALQPNETIYMVSVTDPQTYNSFQVALLPYEESQMVAITASRYIETPAEPAVADTSIVVTDGDEPAELVEQPMNETDALPQE